MSWSSIAVGFWPKDRITVPNSIVVMVPLPSLSYKEKVSFNSAICSWVSWSAMAQEAVPNHEIGESTRHSGAAWARFRTISEQKSAGFPDYQGYHLRYVFGPSNLSTMEIDPSDPPFPNPHIPKVM